MSTLLPISFLKDYSLSVPTSRPKGTCFRSRSSVLGRRERTEGRREKGKKGKGKKGKLWCIYGYACKRRKKWKETKTELHFFFFFRYIQLSIFLFLSPSLFLCLCLCTFSIHLKYQPTMKIYKNTYPPPKKIHDSARTSGLSFESFEAQDHGQVS